MSMFEGISDQQLERMANNIDTEDAMHILGIVKKVYIDPHLVEIRQKVVDDYPDPAVVRSELDALSEEEKEDIFYETLHDLIGVLEEIRLRPADADYEELKAMIRDPYTLESLLLVCEHEEHIDPAYSEQLKNFVAQHLMLVGVLLLPEMYTDAERRRVLRDLDYDPDTIEQG